MKLSKLLCSVLFLLSFTTFIHSAVAANKASSGLPLPSSLLLQDYETELYTWLMKQEYKDLGWHADKSVRDTGPYVGGQYFGTHPAVRIYYSPEVVHWLKNGRQGDIADGAMIIKEMYTPPAVLYQELAQDPKYLKKPKAYEKMLGKMVTAWTVMVRDKQGSKDGWFWGGPGAQTQVCVKKVGDDCKKYRLQSIKEAVTAQLDDYSHPLYSGFGAMCLRCHSSAEKEFTFSALENIGGFMPNTDPLRFLVDNSWRSESTLASYPLSLLKDDTYAQSIFILPPEQRPWADKNVKGFNDFLNAHLRATDNNDNAAITAEGLSEANPDFVDSFPGMAIKLEEHIQSFPMQWADHVVPGPEGSEAFITSDNCLGCHGGLGGAPSGVVMFAQTGPNYGEGYNVSEYGEWRWSPMGLAGRDPIFHAQLESEMAYLKRDSLETPSPLIGSLSDNQSAVRNTCLSCHGAMGQRQLHIDSQQPGSSLNPDFKEEYFFLTTALNDKEELPENYDYHKYGNLAREGISCAICHRINGPTEDQVKNWQPEAKDWLTSKTPKELAYGLFHNNTGRFIQGPNDEFYGPFKNVAEKPMEHALGVKPVHNEFTSDSQMCGTCHTINLPNIGMTSNEFPVLTDAEQNPVLAEYSHTIEQATFLEWQNSVFGRDKDKKDSEFLSCQQCHMPNYFKSLDGKVDIEPLKTQIATIQDINYPEAEHRLPNEDIDIPIRPEYRRHEMVGLNVFLLEMFDQFPDLLGVDKKDPMTYATNGTDLAIENMMRQAKLFTATVDVTLDSLQGDELEATVKVTNEVGHRFPSGVAFRRAFLEFTVMEGDELVWASGLTNGAGVILGPDKNPLPTEFLPDANTYQKHHEVITSQDQVQIYEELNLNANQEFTTSFVHRVKSVKDNRLLPKGWRASSTFAKQGEVMRQFMAATDPHGVGNDKDYMDIGNKFAGTDSLQYKVTLPRVIAKDQLKIKATLYYQAIPPYWLQQRFEAAPEGAATQRLFFLSSHLNVKGTVIEDWKLPINSGEWPAEE